MITVHVSTRAIVELQEIADFYNQIRPALGAEFEDEAEACIRLIQKLPHRPQVHGSVSFRSLKRFPYLAFYTFDEPSQHVTLLSVLHAKRNPTEWPGIN